MKVILILLLGGNTTDVLDFIWPKKIAEIGEGDMSCQSPDIFDSSDTKYNNKEPDERQIVTYLLKSLVLNVQECSSKELKQTHTKLIPFMDEIHHDLMSYLMKLQL